VRILVVATSWIGVLLIPIFVVCSILTGLFFDAGFYHAGQAKYQVQLTTDMSSDQLDLVNQGIVRFFAGNETLPEAIRASGGNPDVFKEKEVLHMNDVRTIVRFISRLQLAGLLGLAIFAGLAALDGRLFRGRRER